jgi:hypothetical protein
MDCFYFATVQSSGNLEYTVFKALEGCLHTIPSIGDRTDKKVDLEN